MKTVGAARFLKKAGQKLYKEARVRGLPSFGSNDVF